MAMSELRIMKSEHILAHLGAVHHHFHHLGVAVAHFKAAHLHFGTRAMAILSFIVDVGGRTIAATHFIHTKNAP
jgi:hypothetical protein